MTREEAIDTLKNGLWWDRKQLDEAIDIAVSALRPVSRECGNKAAKKIVQEVLKMIKAEELAKKMRKQRCHHCKDGRSFDGQFIFCGNKGLFSLHFCPGCGAPLTENGEEILVGRLNEALKDG